MTDVLARVSQLRDQLGYHRVAASGGDFAAALSSAQGATGARNVTATDAVAAAKQYLGVPYVWGGTDPAKGLDCSGLMQRAFADIGVKLPRIAADQARVGTAVPSMAQAKPGDLLAFHSPVDHIGMYVGDGMMIAAPRPGEKVRIQKVNGTPTAIRRVLPSTVDTPGYPGVLPANMRPAGGVAGVPYAELFNAAGVRHGISPRLLAAVAKVESDYDPRVVSSAGARGLMQIMPATAKSLGVADPFDPAQAVDGAARLLRSNIREFGGDLDLALAAYNAGSGAVRKYGGIPPYAETRAYVPKVKAALAALEGLTS
ncbi:hypothetical protein Val02_77110 [Virgisporangium aliadipatigenens]|uniref:NlpC/P60 domain-containing protein n=1 Tax=Virgisporangium aliadipatigenens TaxID=741659 RepID=A0A8J3YW02_9ACTN|nr:hypothetical protein Val02_77110 [Virgisporangium aliadipatigenens]